MEAVTCDVCGVRLEIRRHKMTTLTARKPVRERGVEVAGAGAEIPPKRLRQRREQVHRWKRGEEQRVRCEAGLQQVGQRALARQPAGTADAAGHVIDTQGKDHYVEAVLGQRCQVRMRVSGGVARPRLQPPIQCAVPVCWSTHRCACTSGCGRCGTGAVNAGVDPCPTARRTAENPRQRRDVRRLPGRDDATTLDR